MTASAQPPPIPAAARLAHVTIVRATVAEAAGATLMVAGLAVLERSVRQLGRQAGMRVLVASDGAFALPPTLPSSVEVHRLEGDADAAVEKLRSELGAVVVAGNMVRLRGDALTGGVRVIDEISRLAAEDAIFADLLRGDLGFVARHLNKKISFRITRHLLCHLPITPNQVTLGAAALGLVGCLLLASGGYALMLAGMVLAQVQSILDGCDGELARVRFQQSHIGEWLDTLVDDFMNVALVSGIAIGLHRSGYSVAWTVGGFLAVAMYLFYNVVSYRELIRQGVGGELINIRWKAAKGRDMKSMASNQSAGLGERLLALGRRDTFVLGWLILAVLHAMPVAIVWALIVAGFSFWAALVQVTTADAAPDSTDQAPPGPTN
jgi:phosphatidylglycerophosphate synthase